MRKVLVAILVLMLGILSSCQDDDDVVIVRYVYAYEDAEEILAESIAYGSYGFVANLRQASEEIQTNTCEQSINNSDSFSDTNLWGSVTYDYMYTEEYTNYCNPEAYVTYDLEATQNLGAYNYDFEHDISLNFQVTGLDVSSDSEYYLGDYDRSGEWKALYDDDLRYTFILDIDFENLSVSKSSNKIYAGEANFVLEQVYNAPGLVYTYSGSIEFLSENEAKVTYDNGESFIIYLNNISLSN
ncbi:hypothetical protein [Neptunitalea chrysea]|uniref:hypothetical protein n=1 Tax=Neptunitalea chrysea TaxID=1647581 RepID=UPI00248FFF5A|nr:hypothetical protein [Neptunitalea chrysea]